MADKGISGFRSKFGGFHKDDVLQYINQLQEEHSREVAYWQEQVEAQRAAYDKALTDANAALVKQFDELQSERAEGEQLQRLLTEQYEVNRTLRSEADKAAAAKSAEAAQKAQIAALQQEAAQRQRDFEAELAALKAENARYQAQAQQVDRLIAEIRAAAQQQVEEATGRCRQTLNTLQGAIASLKTAEVELAAADEALKNSQSDAGVQLDELERELEQTAKAAETPAPAHFF